MIDCIDVGIAEDAGAMIEIWKNPFGYIKENKKMVIDSSPWGTPAVVVHFKDGDILTFSCYVKEKKIESKKKNVFQKIIFIFKYRKAVKNS
ncbi:hypothetical protein D3C75_1139070 [compost metagenome]